ncbi:hypothetical protein H671_xg20682 [Cricetulus griseus]|nr:hypothetical protein H671_xg20682 [Cricetulus griseus]
MLDPRKTQRSPFPLSSTAVVLNPPNAARTSRTIVKRYGESGQPFLVPDFKGIGLSFSPFNLMLDIGLLYIAFIMLRIHELCNWVLLNFSEFVPSVFEVEFVYMVDYIDGFSYVEPSLHPWNQAYLIVVDNFSDMFLDSVRKYFIEYFSFVVHEGYRGYRSI